MLKFFKVEILMILFSCLSDIFGIIVIELNILSLTLYFWSLWRRFLLIKYWLFYFLMNKILWVILMIIFLLIYTIWSLKIYRMSLVIKLIYMKWMSALHMNSIIYHSILSNKARPQGRRQISILRRSMRFKVWQYS